MGSVSEVSDAERLSPVLYYCVLRLYMNVNIWREINTYIVGK